MDQKYGQCLAMLHTGSLKWKGGRLDSRIQLEIEGLVAQLSVRGVGRPYFTSRYVYGARVSGQRTSRVSL